MTDTESSRRQRSTRPEQLTLLPSSDEKARFRLSRATRERGLRHVAEIRQQLAERQRARDEATIHRLPPRQDHAA